MPDLKSRNPLEAFEVDPKEHARDSAMHHIENAITSLCVALQWCESPGQSFQILEALTSACRSKFVERDERA